jgi:hypothetical protein
VLRLSGRSLTTALSLVLAVALAGCGDDKSSTAGGGYKPKAISAKTAKLANTHVKQAGSQVYGAFQRYLVKPLNAGDFAAGSGGRKQAVARAETSVLFMVRQLGQLKLAALSDPRLSQVSVAVDDLVPRLGVLVSKLRSGSVAGTDVNAAERALDTIVSAAKQAGADIPLDTVPAVPGVN